MRSPCRCPLRGPQGSGAGTSDEARQGPGRGQAPVGRPQDRATAGRRGSRRRLQSARAGVVRQPRSRPDQVREAMSELLDGWARLHAQLQVVVANLAFPSGGTPVDRATTPLPSGPTDHRRLSCGGRRCAPGTARPGRPEAAQDERRREQADRPHPPESPALREHGLAADGPGRPE